MRYTLEEKAKARRMYVENRMTNMQQLEEILGISRKTLAKWRDEDKWDDFVAQMQVDPSDILQIYLRRIYAIAKEMQEKELNGELVSDLEFKRLAFYQKRAREIDAQFDIRGTLVKFSHKYIDFVAQLTLPEKEKAQFIATLQKTLPQFMDFIGNG